MTDGQTVLVAIMALCGADLALIWNELTMASKVHDLDEDMRATLMWFIRREARRMREYGDSDGEED